MTRYLLEESSGPFLNKKTAHYDISFSCTAILYSSLDFVDPEVPSSETLRRIGLGYFGLYLYASEHWPEHLLSFAAENQGLPCEPDDPLKAQILRFIQRHNQLTDV